MPDKSKLIGLELFIIALNELVLKNEDRSGFFSLLQLYETLDIYKLSPF